MHRTEDSSSPEQITNWKDENCVTPDGMKLGSRLDHQAILGGYYLARETLKAGEHLGHLGSDKNIVLTWIVKC
jgi:hypothetical protein